jgi:hypothetical protein
MTPIEMLRIIIGFIIINFLPGYMFSHKMFPNSDFALRLASSIILSMVTISIPPMILTLYLGLSWMLGLYITLTITAIVSIYYLMKNDIAKPRFSGDHLLIFLLVALAVFRYYYPYITSGSAMPFGFDPILHCRNVKNIVNNIPTTYVLYLPTLHFMLAANVVVLGLSPPHTFMLITPLILVLIALEVYVFTKKIFNSTAGILSFITFTFLTIQPFQTLTDGSAPELFGLAISILGFIKLLDLIEDKATRSLIYTSILFACSLYAHITSLTLLSALILTALILAASLTRSTPKTRDVKPVLGIFIVVFLAILLSLPASTMYIAIIASSLAGDQSSIPITATRPSFPYDFENVLGGMFLYLGVVSAAILPIIARRKELVVVYSILTLQIAIIELGGLASFRVLRQLSIPLSILTGSFLYFTPKIIFYLALFTSIILTLTSKAGMKLSLIVRCSTMFYVILIIIIASLQAPQVINSSIHLGSSMMWYIPEDTLGYQALNNLPNGTVLTDFSCGWLPYFTDKEVIIIPPLEHWEIYSPKDQKMFNELLLGFTNKNITKAYTTLSKYNVSYIFLGSNPKGRHWVPGGYEEVRNSIEELAKLLNSSGFLKPVFNSSNVKIYKVEYRGVD